jgi:NAD+ diphosphatase
MTHILPTRPNVYTGSPLNRPSAMRDDAAWVEQSRHSAQALIAPLWRAKSLLRGVEQGQPEAVFLTGEAADALRAGTAPWAFLGLHGDAPVFAVDLSAAEDPLPESLGTFTDLRATAGLLPRAEASILAHARGLMHWRARHLFCGACGAPTQPKSAGNVVACTGCGSQHVPRTDPAVIMLVHDGDRALLGHSTRFPNSTMYSTLAGFVEPGESLEEAVAREVFEESGIRTGRVTYHSSQPWPFPASIMLGFYAEALSPPLPLDPDEIADARWFTRDDLRNHAALGFSLPRADSIARRLIEDWIAAA